MFWFSSEKKKEKKNDEGERFKKKKKKKLKLKNKCLDSHLKKIRKMTRASENAIPSEKCMHFTCFPRLSIS